MNHNKPLATALPCSPPQAKPGRNVFVKNLPRFMNENELKELFGPCGKIESLRLMKHQTGSMKQFAFIKYSKKAEGQKAIQCLNGHMIHPGLFLEVCPAITNKCLFVGNIPKIKGKDELLEVFLKISPEIKNLIVYPSLENPRQKNRGFCFLEYEDNSKASQGLKKLMEHRPGRVFDCDYHVDWADEEQMPDDEIMTDVKTLYIRNLSPTVTETQLQEVAQIYGEIEKIKIIKNFAFVHYTTRKDAEDALVGLNGKMLGGKAIEVTWSRPPTVKAKLEKIRLIREVRTAQLLMTENSPSFDGNINQNLNYDENSSQRQYHYSVAEGFDLLTTWRHRMNASFGWGEQTLDEYSSITPAPTPQYQDNSKLETNSSNSKPKSSKSTDPKDTEEFIDEQPVPGLPFFVPKKFQTMAHQLKRHLKTLEPNPDNN